MNLNAKSDLFTLPFESHYLPKSKTLPYFYHNFEILQSQFIKLMTKFTLFPKAKIGKSFINK